MADIKIHKFCAVFPEASDNTIEALAADIAANGLLEPIVLYEGKMLDGRTRGRACMRAGIQPTFVDWEKDIKPTLAAHVGPMLWVLSKNLHRRHMDPSQCALVSAKALPELEAEILARGVSDIGQKAKKGRSSRQLARKVNKLTDKKQAVETAAAASGASPRSIYRAERVLKHDPKLAKKVEAGKVTLAQAEREVIKQSKPEKPRDTRRTSMAKSFHPVASGVLRMLNQFRGMGITLEDADDVHLIEVLESARSGLEDPQVWANELALLTGILGRLSKVASKVFR